MKLKEIRKEIDRREALQKPVENLKKLYKDLCVVFYEYFDIFSEDIEWNRGCGTILVRKNAKEK